MWHASYICNTFDLDIETSKCTHRCVSAQADTFDNNLGLRKAVLLFCSLTGTLGSNLCCVGRAFFRAAEATSASA